MVSDCIKVTPALYTGNKFVCDEFNLNNGDCNYCIANFVSD